MENKFEFDYFHEYESEQFSFYRIPKLLFTDDYFKALSCEAKVLYGLMLDRMCLSLKNQWIDNEKRVYIVFTLDQVMEYLNCGRDKGMKILSELDTKKGIGLIERVKQGFGKPDAIYVKNFIVKHKPEPDASESTENSSDIKKQPENAEGGDNYYNPTREAIASWHENKEAHEEQQEYHPGENDSEDDDFVASVQGTRQADLPGSGKPTYRGRKNRPAVVEKTDPEKSEKPTCRGRESPPPVVENSDPNNTDINNTDVNDTDLIYQSTRTCARAAPMMDGMDRIDQMDAITTYTNIIKKNIEYDCLVFDARSDSDRRQIDMIVSLMAETLAMKQETVTVAKAEYPYPYVVNKLLRVGYSHVQYILWCLRNQTNKIWNIKAYVLACIFNAPTTMDAYYQAEVNHDMHGEHGG
ncbi:MAG: replication initiator protein A [Lachnospiraceae bacterium]|nr:replication initiator protein A [Lachnospiraceae bacterium]